MQNIKLHEATKQFGISNKLAMFFLEKKNVPVKSHSSVISMEQLILLREFSDNKEKFSTITREFDNIEKEEKRRKREQKAKLEGKVTTDAKAPGKEEAPKEEVKPEAPKPEAPKPEAPKPEAPKPEAPRPEAPRPEAPRPEAPRPEAPRPERKPRPEAPKPERGPRPEREHKKPKEDVAGHKPQKDEEKKKDFKKKKTPPRDGRPGEDRKPGDRKPGDRKPEDRKPGDRKPGDRKPGDRKPGDRKPGDRKPGVEVSRQDKKPDRPSHPPRHKPDKRDKPRQDRQQRGDRKGKRYDQRREKPAPPPPPPEPPKPKVKVFNLPEMIQISDYINIKELAEKLNLKLRDIEERMRAIDKEYLTNQILDIEEVKEICAEFKVEVDIISFEADIFNKHIAAAGAELTPRAAMVSVMGHVDHGKTTLLDTLRNTRVAEREAGGITQKIGAYKLTYKDTDIIFLDTPGHEAFTNIRARGAKVTDLVILVVAANDGVKPQTIEAINHAKAAGVPLVIAINKIDLPGADPNKVKQELSQHNIVVEDWGGDVVSVEISAKNNQNLDALLEMVTLVSEMLELKAYKSVPGRGYIIESRLDPKLGPLGTVLLQHGNIKRGDCFICGEATGKIKSIFDDQAKVLNNAEVPIPVEIMGFDNVPEAGELFQVIDDVEKARKVIEMRKLREKESKKEEGIGDKKLSLQNLFDRLVEDKIKTFPLIIKSDNFSSAEVLENVLLKQSHEKLKINIIQNGIGNITESDVLLASASNSIVIGFNVKAPQKILGLAKREQIEIKMYNVIYHLIEDIEKAVKGEMEPEYVENRIGEVEVLQIFKISKIGNIAGCLVKEGKINNKSKLKVFRNNDFVFEGEVETLRRVKNEASEVNAGTECGIRIKNFNAIEVGDILEVYEVKVKE